MAISGFQDLLDDGCLISSDAQFRLLDVIGEDTPYGDQFDVDLSAQLITFSGTGQLRARVQYVGSAAARASTAGSWMWGWSNVNGFPDAVLQRVTAVHNFGQQYGVPELTTPELPLTDEPRQTAGRYAVVASLVNGQLPYYTAEIDRGRVVAFLVEHPEFGLRPLDTPRLLTVLNSALMEGVIRDWPRALRQYAAFRGLICSERPGGLALTGPTIDEVRIDLDQQGRVTGFSGTATGG